MVELKNDRILFAAVGTGMRRKELDQVGRPFGDERAFALLGTVDIAPTMARVVLLLVRGAAWATIVVALIASPAPPGKFF